VISRRRALFATFALAACSPATTFLSPVRDRAGAQGRDASSLDRAYAFLDRMMDLYARGDTLRLAQSFVPTKAFHLGATAFTYDQAVFVAALLARGSSGDLARATVLGNSLVYAQTHDPAGDGRVRNAYWVNPFVARGGHVTFAGAGTDTGNMAWTGLALAHLYAATHTAAFLTAATAIADWIVKNTADTRGPGGYTGGSAVRWKSTEHNIDVYALFTLLASLTGSASWSSNAASALSLVDAMWNAKGGFYWIGTLDDGATPNRVPIPEDVQTWSFLATERAEYAASIDWAIEHLAAHDGPFAGVSFSNADRTGVWFEGTAHLAAALLARGAQSDRRKAAAYLADLAYAQKHAPNADGYGIDAASKNRLRTGDGDSYFASLHVGATAWYALAALASNPLRALQ
jgi:uncharacterized protein YyaL (SSP411 family)